MLQRKNSLNIDVRPDEYQRIELLATIHNITIGEFVLEAIRTRVRNELENKDLQAMTSSITPAFKELWDNVKDAEYDKM
ncbi:MAG: hypothetical protein IIA88_04050 [Bacteroidetes bacterium]|nr:hypothetical protein [Bacteroidota bacterium]